MIAQTMAIEQPERVLTLTSVVATTGEPDVGQSTPETLRVERTADLIPDARLLLVEDMGHDRPEPLWPLLCGAILDHTASIH